MYSSYAFALLVICDQKFFQRRNTPLGFANGFRIVMQVYLILYRTIHRDKSLLFFGGGASHEAAKI